MTSPVQPDSTSKKPKYGMDKDDPRVKFALKPLNKTPSDSLAGQDSTSRAARRKRALDYMRERLKKKKG